MAEHHSLEVANAYHSCSGLVASSSTGPSVRAAAAAVSNSAGSGTTPSPHTNTTNTPPPTILAATTSTPISTANPRPLLNQTDQERTLAERFRTQLCRSYERGEVCPYGYKCMFAHGKADLRTVEANLDEGLCTHEKISAFLRHGQLMVGSQCSSPIPPLMSSPLLVQNETSSNRQQQSSLTSSAPSRKKSSNNNKKDNKNKSTHAKGTASSPFLTIGSHAVGGGGGEQNGASVAQWDNNGSSSLPFRFTRGSSSQEGFISSSTRAGNEMRIIVGHSSSSFSLASSPHSHDALDHLAGREREGSNLVFAPPAARLRPVAATEQCHNHHPSYDYQMMMNSSEHLYPFYDSHGEDSDGDRLYAGGGLGTGHSSFLSPQQQQHHHRLRGLSASGNKSEDALFWGGSDSSLLPSPRGAGGGGGRHHQDDSYVVNEFPLRSPLRIESGASSPNPFEEGVSHHYPRGGSGVGGGGRGGRGTTSTIATPHLLSKKSSVAAPHFGSPNGNNNNHHNSSETKNTTTSSKGGRGGSSGHHHSKQPSNGGAGHGLTIRVGGIGGVPSLIVVPQTPLGGGGSKATAAAEKKGGQKGGKKQQQQQHLLRVGSFGSDSSFLGSASGGCEGGHQYFGEATATPLGHEVRSTINGHNSRSPTVIPAGGQGGALEKGMYHEDVEGKSSVPLTEWPRYVHETTNTTPSILMPPSAALPLPSASSVGDKGSVRILSDDFENDEDERFPSFRSYPPSHDHRGWASLSRSNSNYSSRHSSLSQQKKPQEYQHQNEEQDGESSSTPSLQHPPQREHQTSASFIILSREGFETVSSRVGQEGEEEEEEGEGAEQPLLPNLFTRYSSQHHCHHPFDGDASRSYCAETLVLSSVESTIAATTIANNTNEEQAAAVESEEKEAGEGGRRIIVGAESKGKLLGAGRKVVEIEDLAMGATNTVNPQTQQQQQHVNTFENEIIIIEGKLPSSSSPSSLSSFQNSANKKNDNTSNGKVTLDQSNFMSNRRSDNGGSNQTHSVTSTNPAAALHLVNNTALLYAASQPSPSTLMTTAEGVCESESLPTIVTAIEPSATAISAATNPNTTTTTTSTTTGTATVRRLLSARPPSLLEIKISGGSHPPSPSPSPATATGTTMHMSMNGGVLLSSIRKTSYCGALAAAAVGGATNENECSETAACSSSACSFATKTNTTTTEPTSNANTPHNFCSTNVHNKNSISTGGVTFVTTAPPSTVAVGAAPVGEVGTGSTSSISFGVATHYHHHQHCRQNSGAAAHSNKSLDDLNLSTSDATVIVHHTRQVSAAGSSEFSSVMACLKTSTNGLTGVVPTAGGDVFASSVPTSSSSTSNNNNASGVVKDYTINKSINIKIVNHLRVNASGAGSSLLVPPSTPPMPAPSQPAPHQASSSLLPVPTAKMPSSPLRQRQLKHHKSSSTAHMSTSTSSAGVVGISEGHAPPHHGSPACRPQFCMGVSAPTRAIHMSSEGEGCECDEGRLSSRGGGVFAAGVMQMGSGSRRRTIGGYSSVSPSGGSGQGLSLAGVSEECSSLNNTLNNTANKDALEETLLTIAKEIAEEEGQDGEQQEHGQEGGKEKTSEEDFRENECEAEGMEKLLDKSTSPLQPPQPAPAPARRSRRGKGSKGGESSFSASSRPTAITLPKVDSIRIGGAGATPLLHILVANNNHNNNNDNNTATTDNSMQISLSSMRSPRPDPEVLDALNTTRRGGDTEFLHSSKAAMAMALSMSASSPLQISPRLDAFHRASSTSALRMEARQGGNNPNDTFATGGSVAPPRYSSDAAAAFYSAIETIAGGARERGGGGGGNVLPHVEVDVNNNLNNRDFNTDNSMIMSCSAPPPALSSSSSKMQLLVGSGHVKYASASSSLTGVARFRYDPYGSSTSQSTTPVVEERQ